MLIQDLISLPEKVFRGDFVLNLSAGVQDAKRTVDTYVVTDQLVTCFDDALAFIKGALDGRNSRACYLHGSFGSGKSHFMAILHLLLHGDVHARSIPKLAPVVAKHNGWTPGKRFLLIPYHMIGAANMESAILGGYAEHVRRLHPDAPVPPVYKSELLLENAGLLRKQMGDDAFFAALNSKQKSGGWGDLEGAWDAASYEKALAAPRRPKEGESHECERLVQDLVATLLPTYVSAVGNDAQAFIDLDTGLSVVSRHAKDLGYDAVILFLDELVLWLASRAADVGFVHQEGQKLSKLVEATRSDRPVPIVSFVARQRDLRELVGENITGVEQLRFSDALKHWEGRFATIKLEDRNLPAIAAERVLKPKSEGARQQIDEAFKQTEKYRQEVTDTLLTSHGSREMFRKVYPFSPALVDTLVAVSSMLQRERTALKVMLELLVDQREWLTLGDIVPAGDLWDYVAHGDEAFIDEMRRSFDAARRLYHEQLLPMLEQDHNVRREELATKPWDDPQRTKFRNDERLLKTLLLAALVPQVESFRGMTGAKLAALNHGTIRSPIPGREGQMVVNRCKNWGARVGQIRVTEDANPTIAIVLSGVDTESILEKAKSEDNHGNRRRKIWEILCEQFGIENTDQLQLEHDFVWRGTRRRFNVLFANVRDLPAVSLQNEAPPATEWKVIVDFPFDVEGFGPADDRAKLEEFAAQTPGRHLTLAWLPTFLSLEVQRELGKLVLLDFCLKEERFNGLAAHLSPIDRAQARSLMENQRSQLRQKMIKCLEAAYGTDNPLPGALDTTHDLPTHVYSLDQSFRPQPPVGANLKQQLEQLVAQALEHQYPAHPLFEGEVRASTLKSKVYPELQRAIQSDDGRVLVEQPLRTFLKQVANPLRLGEMAETHFVLGNYWKTHFERKHAADGGPITVEKLVNWIDEPTPMGLTKEVRNLLILGFAEQTNRSFFRHGGPYEPTLDDVPRDLELRSIHLPPKQEWDRARARADAVFGTSTSPLLNAINLAKLADDVRTVATQYREPCARLVARLNQILPQFAGDREQSTRFRTAAATSAIVEAVLTGRDDVVTTLNKAAVPTTEAAMGTSLKKATGVVAALDQPVWNVFEGLSGLAGDKQSAAQAILTDLRQALNADEHAIALAPVLSSLHQRAVKLLVEQKPVAPPATPLQQVTPPVTPPAPGWKKDGDGVAERLDLAAFDELVRTLRQKLENTTRLTIRWETYRREK